MVVEISFDLAKFKRAVQQSPQAIQAALQSGLTDIKNDWKADSVDVAPIDSGNLRRQIDGQVTTINGDAGVEMDVPAVRKNFNYAYYIHEDKGVTHSGEKKFLDVVAKQNESKWARWLEEEIEAELKKAGWR